MTHGKDWKTWSILLSIENTRVTLGYNMQMERRWKILPVDKQKSDLLRQSLKISPVICDMLVQRGIETFDQSKKYFRPELADLHDP